MVVRTFIQPVDTKVRITLSDLLPVEMRSALFADMAGTVIEAAKETNKRALGYVPPYSVSVQRGSSDQISQSGSSSRALTISGQNLPALRSLDIGDSVVAEFELIGEALDWISDQLETHSPVKTGTYQKSHLLLADGVPVKQGDPLPLAKVYLFINAVPYARKIEKGSSSQAPNGVYHAVATLASQRFGNSAKISFGWESLPSGAIANWAATTNISHKGHATAKNRAAWLTRQPAITVTARV